jgi:hypothetical protein
MSLGDRSFLGALERPSEGDYNGARRVAVAAISEAQIDALANHLVHGLITRGIIKPKTDEKDVVACVVELMSANFEEDARMEDEADKQAEVLMRQNPGAGADPTRLRTMIKQRLAEKKNFTL